MNYVLLLSFTFILSQQLSDTPYFYKKKTFAPFPVKESLTLSGQNFALYRATIIGDKRGISRKLKNSLKKFGLSHLLTPSGLHLSSLMPLLVIPMSAQVLVLFLFFLWISTFGSYLSLERVVMFALIMKISNLFKKKISVEFGFCLCMLASLATGNAAASPHSFLYSSLFWGTIIIFRENPVRVIIFMNLSLQFISCISDSACTLSSIVINPLFSMLYITMFPVFILNMVLTGVPWLELLISNFLDLWVSSLLLIESFEQNTMLQLSLITILLIIYFALKHSWKLAVFAILLNITNAGEVQKIVKYSGSKIYTDNCSHIHYGLKCKKKPSS